MKLTKKTIEELRKRNPYADKNNSNVLSIGWDDCCNELEKMEKE